MSYSYSDYIGLSVDSYSFPFRLLCIFLCSVSLYINMIPQRVQVWFSTFIIKNTLFWWVIHSSIWFGIMPSSYKCDQVPGVLAAEVSTAAEDDQRHEEDCIGHIVCPWIFSHKVLGLIDEGEDSNEGESDHQLHCENQEDLVIKRSWAVFS